jgi:hypothetical protein
MVDGRPVGLVVLAVLAVRANCSLFVHMQVGGALTSGGTFVTKAGGSARASEAKGDVSGRYPIQRSDYRA